VYSIYVQTRAAYTDDAKVPFDVDSMGFWPCEHQKKKAECMKV